jgi:hypothetical protein
MAIKYSSIGGGTGTGFNVQIGSKYSYATFTQAQPAGSYTIKSAGNYTNWDVYVLDASNNLVAYTGGAALSAPSSFSGIVVLNGSINDILQFSFQSTVTAAAETTQTTAGPFITAATPTSLPNINNTTVVTGGNFAAGITATFTGTDLVGRTAKGIVRTSATSLTITRPDSMPATYAPYTLTLGNPGINNPTNSNAHTFTNITVGVNPVWQTSATQAIGPGPYSLTVLATDADGGSSVTYSYVSGSLPTGFSFNAGSATISGTPTGAAGTSTYTIRATDSGGNYTDQTFSLTVTYPVLTGGALTSDTTYYYRTFTGNGSLQVSAVSISVDMMIIAGGGGGGGGYQGGGGGAGGALRLTGQSLSVNTYTVIVGGGGRGASYGNIPLNGSDSSLGSNTATGGGSGNAEMQAYGATGSVYSGNGGSGGGTGHGTYGAAGTGIAGQGFAGGTTWGSCCTNAGGGGAGGIGGYAPSDGNPGVGGIGTNSHSSWLTAITSAMSGVSGWSTATSTGYIAGGGAGSARTTGTSAAGGAGGGGAGGVNSGGTGAISNTGGGGGAGGNTGGTGPGGGGGSGIVVVRYPKSYVGG